MNTRHIFGITAVAVGVVLLVFAQRASQAPVDQISNMMTGRYSDETIMYFVSGIAVIVGGGLSIAFAKRSSS